MSSISDKERLDYSWKHFALIADQRVKTFNFYIIVALAAFSATIGVLKPDTSRHVFCVVGSAHMLVALVFWLIDFRGCRLLAVASDALKQVEGSEAFASCLKPVTEDRERNKRGIWYFVSYRAAFWLAFVIHFAFGVILAWRPSLFFG